MNQKDNICFLGFSTIPKTGAGGCTFLGFGLLGPRMYQIPNWVSNLVQVTQIWDLVFWDRSNVSVAYFVTSTYYSGNME